MIKNIALIQRKAGLSQADFIQYYETQHAPLILKLFPMISDYRRNYISLEGAYIFPDAGPVDFHSITEIRFNNAEDHAAFTEKAARPDIAKMIADDESNFLVSRATRMFIVDERQSAA